MIIAIGADHGGFDLKENIKKHYPDAEFIDVGTHDCNSVDYPDIARKVTQAILTNQADLGILICGTGVGISIAANRRKGIRAALIYNKEVAKLAKQHNNANVLVFGGRTMSIAEVADYIDIFMNTEYEGGRHQRRLDKIEEID